MSSPALDPKVLATLRQLNQPGEPDVVGEVLALFRVDAPGRIEAITQAAAAGDSAGLQRAAHTLKGAAGSIGATELQRVCRALEEAARAGHTVPASSSMAELHHAFAQVRAAIDQLL
ncbi:MAG TPA: Hpt domain-containing protein [Vicinamibacterales bacterium]|nr:Hpt domain-containing protein [Vicinamibacterales bacterium]